MMTQNSSSNSPQLSIVSTRKWELGFVLLFVVVHLTAPWWVGELYPFTVAPMFRDQPSHYCTYEVEDAEGNRLDPKEFGLHLVYDGNPVGFGVGLKPVPTLHEFGDVPSESEVRRHVQAMLESKQLECVVVRQTKVCCEPHSPHESVSTWTIALESSRKGTQ